MFPFAVKKVEEENNGKVAFTVCGASAPSNKTHWYKDRGTYCDNARVTAYQDTTFDSIAVSSWGDRKIMPIEFPVFTILTYYYWSDTKHHRTTLYTYRLIFDRVETRFAARIRY